jgi:hypothetical protein
MRHSRPPLCPQPSFDIGTIPRRFTIGVQPQRALQHMFSLISWVSISSTSRLLGLSRHVHQRSSRPRVLCSLYSPIPSWTAGPQQHASLPQHFFSQLLSGQVTNQTTNHSGISDSGRYGSVSYRFQPTPSTPSDLVAIPLLLPLPACVDDRIQHDVATGFLSPDHLTGKV